LAFAPRNTNPNSHFLVIAVPEWQYLDISLSARGSTDYRLRVAFKSDPELLTITLAILAVTRITEVAKFFRGTELAFTVAGALARRTGGFLLRGGVSSKGEFEPGERANRGRHSG
jgi:hypothetical protein